jgi:hypothetical protein
VTLAHRGGLFEEVRALAGVEPGLAFLALRQQLAASVVEAVMQVQKELEASGVRTSSADGCGVKEIFSVTDTFAMLPRKTTFVY